MPKGTISRYFLFQYFWYVFFAQYKSNISREKSYSQISRFLSQFFNIKNSTLWKSLAKSNFHDHNRAVIIIEWFLLEVISRSQLLQNSKFLYLCFRRRPLQNWHGSEWNIAVCVILVSPYSVHELPLLNCMRGHFFETWKS